MSEYERGFRDAQDQIKKLLDGIRTSTDVKPGPYEPWATEDRRPGDVLNDAIRAVDEARPGGG